MKNRKNSKHKDRIGLEKLNNQNSLMKIIEYNNAHDITVEFQDEYKTRVHAQYQNFVKGNIKNPYSYSVVGVGAIGTKYKISINGKNVEEYELWRGMLRRCFDTKEKEKHSTYKDATCCDEWLLFENFYEWLHNQENYNKHKDKEQWSLDKDILIKGNKIYSPDTCCLVTMRVNVLFTKSDKIRGDLPIGVTYHNKTNKYNARISKLGKNGRCREHLGYYSTPEEAFKAYKKAKEKYIKQIAQEEYDKGNITKQCYEAMMNYEVEITD